MYLRLCGLKIYLLMIYEPVLALALFERSVKDGQQALEERVSLWLRL